MFICQEYLNIIYLFYSNDSNVELGDFHGNYESTPPPHDWYSPLDDLYEPIIDFAEPTMSWDYSVCPLPSPKKEIEYHTEVEDKICIR